MLQKVCNVLTCISSSCVERFCVCFKNQQVQLFCSHCCSLNSGAVEVAFVVVATKVEFDFIFQSLLAYYLHGDTCKVTGLHLPHTQHGCLHDVTALEKLVTLTMLHGYCCACLIAV